MAVLVLALVLLDMSREPDLECSGGTTPGALFDERDPGAVTADAAVTGFITEADHYTSEPSRGEPDVVTYRTYDEGDRPLIVVEAEHRLPKGWFVGHTTTCQWPDADG
ncbi:hypothetical protein ASG94_11190 [Nocardioides sp. Soil805]|nr:hypothetical protein ASG94_11190 [Nocardioides sp. Soil805]